MCYCVTTMGVLPRYLAVVCKLGVVHLVAWVDVLDAHRLAPSVDAHLVQAATSERGIGHALPRGVPEVEVECCAVLVRG